MRRENVYVMAIDIEMSGSTLRNPSEGTTKIGKPQGDIIGIGACVMFWNEETKSMEIAETEEGGKAMFFEPMFRPFNKYHSPGTLVMNGFMNEFHSKAGLYWFQSRSIEDVDKFSLCVFSEGSESVDGPIYSWEIENSTVFERLCFDEFWSKHPDMLKQLEYKGPRSKKDMEGEALSNLRIFRSYWENYAINEMEGKIVVVSDNVSFDIGTIDQLMRQYFPESKNSLYQINFPEKYNGGIPCTHSMQAGLLSSVDPLWLMSTKKDDEPEWIEWLVKEGEVEDGKPQFWSRTARIRYLYSIPKPEVDHDHNPANDAYTIACEYLAIHAIAIGEYTLDPSKVLKKRKRPSDEKS